MGTSGVVERLIVEAYWRREKITIKAREWICEGKVERIYENRIVKFSVNEGKLCRTGFFLISDIEAIF